MKKVFFTGIGVLCSIFLVGCSATPEEVYMDSLEGQISRLESLGDWLSTLGDQMLDENFNQAFTTLTLVQDDIDALELPTYVWTNAFLKTADQELTNALDQTALLTELLQPVLQKAAENDAWSASQEDLSALQSAEEITTKIEIHMDAAGEALDAYETE